MAEATCPTRSRRVEKPRRAFLGDQVVSLEVWLLGLVLLPARWKLQRPFAANDA